MNCPQMLGQHKDTKNDPSFNHGCKTCDMMEECMEHKEALLKKAEGELKAIKARIEAVTITKLLATTFKEACIGCKYIGSGCGCIAIDNILGEATNRIIKQIGGEK